MVDELQSIKADLDSVLDRLAKYIGRDSQETCSEHDVFNREDAARTVLNYLSFGNDSLSYSVKMARYEKKPPSKSHFVMSRPEAQAENTPDKLIELLEALEAVYLWKYTLWPLEDKHMLALSESVEAWSVKECQFIGESAGLALTPKRQIDRRKRVRDKAAFDVYELHINNPDKYPLAEPLFEEVGKRYAMSASVVSRAYYTEKNKKIFKSFTNLRKQILSKTDDT